MERESKSGWRTLYLSCNFADSGWQFRSAVAYASLWFKDRICEGKRSSCQVVHKFHCLRPGWNSSVSFLISVESGSCPSFAHCHHQGQFVSLHSWILIFCPLLGFRCSPLIPCLSFFDLSPRELPLDWPSQNCRCSRVPSYAPVRVTNLLL